MGITFEDIQQANTFIKTTPIKGKEYAEVNQRIKAFRFLYPSGAISTELLSDDGERCVFKATVLDDAGNVLGTGTAFENKEASFINKTSYIENCETSAVGRALAMCGIGIDVSIASFEEVSNAIENQNKPQLSEKDIAVLESLCKRAGLDIKAYCKMKKINSLAELTVEQYKSLAESCDKQIASKKNG